MQEFLRLSRAKPFWFWSLAIVTIVVPIFMTYLYSSWYGVDTTSYFTAAEYYASFDFPKAINGYWSPLLSWLLVPFVWIGLDLMIAFRLLQVVFLWVALVAIGWMLAKFINATDSQIDTSNEQKQGQGKGRINDQLKCAQVKIGQMLSWRTKARTGVKNRAKVKASDADEKSPYLKAKLVDVTLYITYLALVVVLSFWSASSDTPDFMSGLITFAAIWAAMEFIKRPSFKVALALGVLLALVYFTKSFGFYVAGLMLVVLSIVVLLGGGARAGSRNRAGGKNEDEHRPRGAKLLGVSALVFAVLSGAWMGLIYVKYDTLTISTASEINFNLIGPDSKGHKIEQPNLLLEPTYHNSYSAWYDPTYIPPEAWSLEGNEDYYIKHVKDNLKYLLTSLLTMTPLLLILSLVWLKGYVGHRSKQSMFLILFISLGLVFTVIGYSLVFAAERYLYIIVVPIILIGFYVLGRSVNSLKVWQLVLVSMLSLLAVGLVFKDVSANYRGALFTHSLKSIYGQIEVDLPNGARTAIQSIDILPACFEAKLSCTALNHKLPVTQIQGDDLIDELVESDTDYYITRSELRRDDVRLFRRYVDSSSGGLCILGKLSRQSCPQAALYIYQINKG